MLTRYAHVCVTGVKRLDSRTRQQRRGLRLSYYVKSQQDKARQ